jgi:2-polyprenyl-6-methoxyphenol hydroxylase-like FAD-dependent oxidoreductase
MTTLSSGSGFNLPKVFLHPRRRQPMSGQPRALVIGGSVGGLFAAHMLRSIGWDVVVFERSGDDLAQRGAGIGASDAMFAVMRRIGVPFRRVERDHSGVAGMVGAKRQHSC